MPENEVAFGFIGLQDLFDQRVNQVGVSRVYDAIVQTATEYSRVMLAVISEFATRTIVAQQQIELPGGGTLQPLGPDGNPLPEKSSASYKAAWPIQGGGTAIGTNRITAQLTTVREINKYIMEAGQKDADWNIRHALAAILDNTPWIYLDKTGGMDGKGLGKVTILPLANNDDVVYARRNAVKPAKADHYRSQSAPISDAENPFKEAREILHSYPSNRSGEIICYIAKNLKESVEGLTSFAELRDPDVKMPSTVAYVDGQMKDATGVGDEYIGKVDRIHVVVWDVLPDNYMLFKIIGKPCLRMREYPVPALQGFFPELADVDGNHQDVRIIRFAGYGVSDRLAALMWQIETDEYEVPAGFETPLAV